jgi:hypothetical protein
MMAVQAIAPSATVHKTFDLKPWRSLRATTIGNNDLGIRYTVDNVGATLVATGFA